ncbi:MAG: enolase C-terminal domain-like protein [Acidimicrobiia bacterium]
MANQPVTIFHLEIPLRTPFSTAGGTLNSRGVALVRSGDGPFGWGEAAPFPGQDEPMADVLRAVRAGESTPTLKAALDEAGADLRARIDGDSLFRIAGAARETIPVSLAVGLGDPVGAVERGVGRGVSRFKLKIAPGRLGHVVEIRRKYPDVVIGLDANGSFDIDSAAELQVVANLDIAYLEQPVADLDSDAAKATRDWVGAPLFADESVRSVADAERILSFDDVDGVVIKPGRLGWSGALGVRDLANAAGKHWRSSGLLETGIGRSYTDILSACSDAFVSDVAPAEWFLERDVTGSRFDAGSVSVPRGPGLGVAPDPDLLARHLVERIDLS